MNRFVFASRLLCARKRAGLTQAQLAERVCISRQDIGRYENRKHLPLHFRLVGICRELDVSIDWICGIEPLSCPNTEKKDETP
jgi:transcriptional regulator with XRE-family HTH domain